jgi:hypothetical protein
VREKAFKLKKTPYGWLDFFAIPFSCDFTVSAALGIQKLLTALPAVFQVVVMADFLDCTNKALKAGTGIFTERLRIRAAAQINMALTDKRVRLRGEE